MKSRAAVAFAAGEPLKIVEIDVAPPRAGEVLVRTDWLSFDPAQKSWMENAAGYMDPVEIGGVMPGSGVGVVILTGAGKAFSAGGNVKAMREGGDGFGRFHRRFLVSRVVEISGAEVFVNHFSGNVEMLNRWRFRG